MKSPFYLLSLLCLILIANNIYAQSNDITHEQFRDSIINRYQDGQHPSFSIDSALYYLPQDAYLWQQKGMPLIKQMKYELGIRYIDSAVKYNTERYIDYRGFCKCIFQKNYSGAIADFHEAKRIIGESVVMDHEYNFYIGLSQLQLNRFDSAQFYFSLCEQSDGKKLGAGWMHFLHAFYMGTTLMELHREEEAIPYFDKALKEYSHFSDVKYYKALCLARRKDYLQAQVLLEAAAADLKQGYTINEDNSWYEKYPYQINEKQIKYYQNWVSAAIKK